MATTVENRPTMRKGPHSTASRKRARSSYPLWFYLPAGVLFAVLFIVPTFASFFFSLTRWTIRQKA